MTRPSIRYGLVLALLVASPAGAQIQRPGDQRPVLAPYAETSLESLPIRLPPLPPDPLASRMHSGKSSRVLVNGFRVVGSSVFSGTELAAQLAPFVGRELGSEELLRARDSITRHYVDQGYVTSGAVLPDQTIEDGIVEIQVIEGQLGEVRVEGTRRFRERYFEERIKRAGNGPLHVAELGEHLQLLQDDSRVRRIDAELVPGARRGRSDVRIKIEEADPYSASLSLSNIESPSVGSEGGTLRAAHGNLLGFGDTLSASLGSTEGLDDWSLRYALPLNARDTSLELYYLRSDSEVVERPFDDIDVQSDSVTYGLEIRHPLIRTPRRQFWLGIAAELRRSESFILGERFGFVEGSSDDTTRVSVVRAFQEWSSRGPNRVIAARSMFSMGLDVFDASDSHSTGAESPDGTFFSWLGQFQWVQRLPEQYRGTELIFRTDVQLARDALLSLEQFSLGGSRTVRGYREDQLVRDNAAVSSLELRIPVLRSSLGRDLLHVAPFVDVGHAWNEARTHGPKTLASLGLGLRWMPWERTLVSVYWGGRLRDVKRRGSNLQNSGFHIEVTALAF